MSEISLYNTETANHATGSKDIIHFEPGKHLKPNSLTNCIGTLQKQTSETN